MEKSFYADIASRFGGDIYIGVVGPTRTGKSTFISKFMESVVLPNIQSKSERERVKDELPQSGSGKTITTTEPKFVPGTAISLTLDKNVDLSVRLVDCVGYLADGALGKEDGERVRYIKTPWSNTEMPFEEAAILGTKKVIEEHSVVGVMVTCDGSVADLPRQSYIESEERIVKDLKSCKKPFVIVLNSKTPDSEECKALALELSDKYGVSVLPKNLLKLNKHGAEEILASLLTEFPIEMMEIGIPKWMNALPYNDPIIQDIIRRIKDNADTISKMDSVEAFSEIFSDSENISSVKTSSNLGNGVVLVDLAAKEGLFYKVISDSTGVEIKDDFELISLLSELISAKASYDKIKEALDEVKLTGYGVVTPTVDEMTLCEPKVTSQNGQYGVSLKASAPSMHIMRVDVDTEINPIVATEQQGEELVKDLLAEFESDPDGIWETKLFGKSLNTLVNDGLNNKLAAMPQEVKTKMRKTVSRIVNEGKGGVICILL